MIKIEKLAPDTRAFITTADGRKQQLLVGQLIGAVEWSSLDVLTGEVTYSVNELEIKTAKAKSVEVISRPTKEKEDTRSVSEVLLESKEIEQTPTTKVINKTNALVKNK